MHGLAIGRGSHQLAFPPPPRAQPDVVTKYKAAAKITNSECGSGSGAMAGELGAAAAMAAGGGWAWFVAPTLAAPSPPLP